MVFVGKDASVEDGRLTEIFRLIKHLFDVDRGITDKTNDFIDLTTLNFVENDLVERTYRTRLLQVVHFARGGLRSMLTLFLSLTGW